jgi:hypothetical protein
MARHPGRRVLMSAGSQTGKHAARQNPVAVRVQLNSPSGPRLGRQPATCDEADPDVDAYITRMVAQAPPLSSQQRDKLALILQPHR